MRPCFRGVRRTSLSSETGSTSAQGVGADTGSRFPLGSTISSLHAVWVLKQELQEFQRTLECKRFWGVLPFILCPQTEPSSPSLIISTPQNSLLDPESLFRCLTSTLAAVVLPLVPLERTSCWRFGPPHSSTLMQGLQL